MTSNKSLLYWINMRKILSFFLIGLFGLMILPKTISAKQYDNLIDLPLDDAQQQELLQLEETPGEVLGTTIVEDVAMDQDRGPHFYFGENVTLNDNLLGDVYVAGGNVEVNGDIDGDLLIAGGTVVLNGDVTQDIRAGGGTILVNGVVGQNLTLGGGSVVFGSGAMVGNSIVAGAGEISLNGEVLGRVLLGGGAAKLAGNYGSDVRAQVDTINVAPGVVIAGSLMAEAQTDAQVSTEADIQGENLVSVTPAKEKDRLSEDKMEAVGGVLVKATLVEFMMKLMMGIVSGGLLIYFLPKLVVQLSNSVITSPMSNLGWGFVYLFLTPIVILLTIVSIVALPIAGAITLFYIFTFIVAKWVSAYAIGVKLAVNLKLKALENKYLGFAVGLFILSAVGFIPVLGWLVESFAFFIGLGAIFTMLKSTVLSKKSRK